MYKNNILFTIFIAFSAMGCATKNGSSPQSNSQLQSVSPTETHRHSSDNYLQRNYDEWIDEEWTPLTQSPSATEEENASIETEEETFRLQNYVDKWKRYLEASRSSDKPSELEKLNAMPVIGTGKK